MAKSRSGDVETGSLFLVQIKTNARPRFIIDFLDYRPQRPPHQFIPGPPSQLLYNLEDYWILPRYAIIIRGERKKNTTCSASIYKITAFLHPYSLSHGCSKAGRKVASWLCSMDRRRKDFGIEDCPGRVGGLRFLCTK